MAQTILIKRSTNTATPTSLSNGELAYSAQSNKLFIGRPGGGSGDIDAIGGKYYTDIIAGAASANTASKLVVRDGSGDFSAGTITATLIGNVTGNVTGNVSGTALTVTQAAQPAITSLGFLNFLKVDNLNLNGNTFYTTNGNLNITPHTGSAIVLDGTISVDAGVVTGATSITSTAFVGTLTGNATTATTLAAARNFSASGDLTAPNVSFNGGGAVDLVTTLATVNSNVGSFGGTTAIPVLTVNAKGLVTAASTVAISSTLDIAADTGTDNGVLVGTDTLTVSGGTGVATSVSGDTITIDIGQAVATTSNVTFNNVTVDGTLTSDDITAATMTASGHVVVQGNLTVNGTTTTVNSNTVAIGDSIMVLNNDETGTPSENAGFEVERGTATNVSVLWNEGTDYWQINDGSTTSKIMTAGNFAASFTGILDGGTF
jgi:hypothetical protein